MTTLIDDRVRTVGGRIDGGRVLVDPAQLPELLGWALEPEGLCRAEVCVPVRDRSALFVGDEIDLAAAAEAVGQPAALDADAGVLAIALPTEHRRRALSEQHAPDFTLDDLDGRPHSLTEWAGQKKLLVAFASW